MNDAVPPVSKESGLGPIVVRPTSLTPRRNLKTSEVIAQRLVNFIIESGLVEGSRLPNESDLVQQLGVGRSTMREALRLLEARGVVTIKSGPGGGPVVRAPRPADLGESLTLYLQFARGSLLDVIEARAALEPVMARLAAQRIDAESLMVLQATIEGIRVDLDDRAQFLEMNRVFHQMVAESSGSVILSAFNSSLKTIADGASAGVRYSARRHAAVADAHERILHALVAGDSDAAEREMHAHLQDAQRFWTRRFPSVVSSPIRWVQ